MVDAAKIAGATAAYKNAMTLPSTGSAGAESPFSTMVGQAIDSAIGSAKGAETAGVKSLLGQIGVDDLAIAVGNAELTLKTVIAVRDKVISAYQDIIKMPI